MQLCNNQPATKLSQIPHHSLIEFSEPHEPKIVFNSKFDSGNLNKVIRNSYDHYSIWTSSDAEGSENAGYPKSWFYFQVGGFGNRKVIFSIHRVHFLWAIASRSHLYRPVFRVFKKDSSINDSPKWQRLPHPVHSISLNSDEELVLKFDFVFSSQIQYVEFAFIYPYSHEECHEDVMKFQQMYENDNDIYFKQYQLCRSVEGRTLDLVIISSHEGKDGFQNIKTDGVFTLGDKKLQKFKNNKPIIFISARVHPIQTPSSFTMLGIIQFLLNKDDYRSFLLRKHFVFVTVPMLNPDGVSNGHCRMDSLNQNLNRYYNDPDPQKQPSCYSVIKLCEHFSKDKRLFMYLDLHAHPANKGNFIFGNAIFDYIEQVQSHLFPKVLSQNCINFQFEQCNFSRKHMKAKDRNEDMNKEGCGRVVFYKEFGLTHSYTLECGYHCNTYNNVLTQQQNQNKLYIARYKINDKKQNIYDGVEEFGNQIGEDVEKFIENLQQKKRNNGTYLFKIFKNTKDSFDDNENSCYKKQVNYFEIETFKNLGRNICISILDIWNKNPYTRIVNINDQRVQIAQKQAQLDRFRKQQVGIKTKKKKIVQLIQTQCYAGWHKRNVFPVQAVSSSSVGFKKNVIRTSLNIKRMDKSITITESRDNQTVSVSAVKISISKNCIRSKKSITKEQKKIGVVQPNIQSIKLINGSEILKGPMPLKTILDSRNFFKPMNLKIRNLQMGGR